MSILSRVQSNPEIGTSNEAYVLDLIQRVKSYITKFCNLPSFPENLKGYLESDVDASEDISNISSSSLYISVNDSEWTEINIDTSDCTSGATIAETLEAAINEASSENGFDEVTVAFDSSSGVYTIESGRYGESSSIYVTFSDETEKHLCKELKLSDEFGGVSYIGNKRDILLEDAAVNLVEMKYREIGLEGLSSGSIPSGVSFSKSTIDPMILDILLSKRRF